MADGSEIHVVVQEGNRGSVVLTVLVCAFFVALAAAKAWRAARRSGGGGSWAERASHGAGFFAAGFTAVGVSQNAGGSGRHAFLAIGAGLVLAFLAFLLLSVAELVTWRLRPHRSRRWLGGSLLLLGFLFLALPAAAYLSLVAGAGAGPGDWSDLELPALVIALALFWWSYLPPPPPLIADVFL